jgi:hypothetical protein
MTAYPGQTPAYPGQTLTWTTLCAAVWDIQSLPVVIQPVIEPGSVVMTLALRCSALDHCTTLVTIHQTRKLNYKSKQIID